MIGIYYLLNQNNIHLGM